MSIWTSLEPASITVDPGATGSVTLRLRNTTDLVEEYRIAVAGETGRWARVEPPTVRLYPGTTDTVEITFAPPRTPEAVAGSHPFAVEVIPTEQSQLKTVVEGNLTLTPFTELRAELLPPTVRGRFSGRPRFAVDNFGNTKVTASLVGKDDGGQLGITLTPANVQIEPGRAAWVKARVKPPRVTWFGSRESHPYAIDIQRSGSEPMPVSGTYVQPAVLPGWLMGFFSLLLVAGIAFAVAWFTFVPRFDSRAREGMQALNPTGNQVTIPTPKPSPKTEEKPEEKKTDKPKETAKPQQGGGPKPKPTVKWIRLVSVALKGCLDNNDDGHSVYILQCNGGDNQTWLWVKAGGNWKLKNKKNGMCLTRTNQTGSIVRSFAVGMADCAQSSAWNRTDPACIREVKTRLCLDNRRDENGPYSSAIYVFNQNNGDYQRWRAAKR